MYVYTWKERETETERVCLLLCRFQQYLHLWWGCIVRWAERLEDKPLESSGVSNGPAWGTSQASPGPSHLEVGTAAKRGPGAEGLRDTGRGQEGRARADSSRGGAGGRGRVLPSMPWECQVYSYQVLTRFCTDLGIDRLKNLDEQLSAPKKDVKQPEELPAITTTSKCGN